MAFFGRDTKDKINLLTDEGDDDFDIDFSPLWQDIEEGGLIKYIPIALAVINTILLIIIWRRH